MYPSGITGTDIILVKEDRIVDVSQCRTGGLADETGVADDDGVVRHIEVDVRTRRNQDIIADLDLADDHGICTDPHVVSDIRGAAAGSAELRTDDYTGGNINIIADHGLRVDNDTPEMRDIKALIDLRLIRDLEMILPRLPVQGLTAKIKAGLVEIILEITDIRLCLLVMVAAMAHIADIVELRARHHLLHIGEEHILVTL